MFCFGVCLLLLPVHSVDAQEDGLSSMWDSLVNKMLGQEQCETFSLPQGCAITPDCTTITCTVTFASKEARIKLVVNKCRKPITVTSNIAVPKADIDWWYTFTTNNTVMIPEFSYKTRKGRAGVYLKFVMTPGKDRIHLKVALLARITKLGITTTPGYMGLVSKKLPVATKGCDFLNWWHVRDTPAHIGLLTALCVVAVGVLSGFYFCCCCCCCCRPCRRSKENRIV